MQSFKNALLFEPLSFCSFACFRQATDFAALCSSCWVGLMFCATRSDFEAELCALAGKPASPRATTKIPADAKRRSMWFLPEEISNFATTVALPQIELSSSDAIAMSALPPKADRTATAKGTLRSPLRQQRAVHHRLDSWVQCTIKAANTDQCVPGRCESLRLKLRDFIGGSSYTTADVAFGRKADMAFCNAHFRL